MKVGTRRDIFRLNGIKGIIFLFWHFYVTLSHTLCSEKENSPHLDESTKTRRYPERILRLVSTHQSFVQSPPWEQKFHFGMGGFLTNFLPKVPKSSMRSFISWWGGGGCSHTRYLVINVCPSNEAAVSYPFGKVVVGVKTPEPTNSANCAGMIHHEGKEIVI